MPQDSKDLKKTPLDSLNRRLGAQMMEFAGYAMPLHYEAGIMAEHLHCRAAAALFDVSHMGQARLTGEGAAAALEHLVPGDITGLKVGRQRYTLLTNPRGGILDDLMVANLGDRYFLIVNASRKADDFAHIAASLPAGVALTPLPSRALFALQGPKAVEVIARHAPEAARLPFLAVAEMSLLGASCIVTRSGYTGEDGFEISVPGEAAETFMSALLAEPEVKPAGLGARDSLRLEAGLCLYGNDLDETTTPIEAGLAWVIGKRRRTSWDFIGGDAIRAERESGPKRVRIGIRPEGRAPVRAGAALVSETGDEVGHVTSGIFSPSLKVPIAMGYAASEHAREGARIFCLVRGRKIPAVVAPMPFVPHHYVH